MSSGPSKSKISDRQIKAARALAGWSQDDLAEASGLSIATIRLLELGHISPRESTSDRVEAAFDRFGIEFIEPNGVREKPKEIAVFEGEKGVYAFYDDVYATSNSIGGDVMIVCRDANTIFRDGLKERMQAHIERMTAIADRVSVKCIMTESRTSKPGEAYCEYRYLSSNLVDSVPFYVYGDKVCFRLLNTSVSPRMIVIRSAEMAETFRAQFASLWDKATLVHKPTIPEKAKPKKKA